MGLTHLTYLNNLGTGVAPNPAQAPPGHLKPRWGGKWEMICRCLRCVTSVSMAHLNEAFDQDAICCAVNTNTQPSTPTRGGRQPADDLASYAHGGAAGKDGTAGGGGRSRVRRASPAGCFSPGPICEYCSCHDVRVLCNHQPAAAGPNHTLYRVNVFLLTRATVVAEVAGEISESRNARARRMRRGGQRRGQRHLNLLVKMLRRRSSCHHRYRHCRGVNGKT